jgi:hypothetical protein
MMDWDKYWVFFVPVYVATLILIPGYLIYLYRKLSSLEGDEE